MEKNSNRGDVNKKATKREESRRDRWGHKEEISRAREGRGESEREPAKHLHKSKLKEALRGKLQHINT